MAFSPIEAANFLRMVPSSAFAGLVAPISLRRSAMALSFSRTISKIGPEDMKVGQFVEERPRSRGRIEALGLRLRDGLLLDGHDLEAGLLDLGQNGPGKALADRVRLDDAEGAL